MMKMEGDQQNLKIAEDNQHELKNILIKTNETEEISEEASSSNENKKEAEESSKDPPKSPQKEERCKSKTPPPARCSPEPSCAICLEHLQNRSFTDSCFHMFCFTCLVEWSKVKPECPLCKQSFKSIVHNVRSFRDFDVYYVNKPRMTDNLWQCVNDRRFRYGSTLTPERLFERSVTSLSDVSERIVSEIASHRMRFAPHSVHSVRMYASSQVVRAHLRPCSFRRRIYEDVLWVRPSTSTRVRNISPAFYRRNIACTHRLLPWLNRELLVVMPNNESQISFVIELIMSLIVKFDITSREFYTHIQPYTLSHTEHFIHEFYHFAISPYESVDSYDLHASYELNNDVPYRQVLQGMSSSEPQLLQGLSSPDSDVIPLASDLSSSQNSSLNDKRKKDHHTKKRHSKESKKLSAKIILKRNSANNCWESVVRPSVPYRFYGNVTSSFEVPGPSTSRDIPFPEYSAETSNQELDESNEVECLGGKDDEECQILEVLKPKRERTPEIVELSSDDESCMISRDGPSTPTAPFPISSPIPEDSFLYSLVQMYGKACSEQVGTPPPPPTHELSDTDEGDDDDILFLSETKPKDSVSDKPIDYSLKTAEKEAEVPPEAKPSSSVSKDSSEQDIRDSKRNSVIQCTAKSGTDEDTHSPSRSPVVRPKKRRALILDDSSDSCSESPQVNDLRIKKLKLRSVLAHFSFDPSDELNDSTHHSLACKKHKERKKKKKKHKHKRHVYSSDSN